MKMTLREPARSKISRRVLSILLTAALCFSLLTPAMAADKAKTIRLIRTEGTVTVTNSSGENLDIWEDMRLYSGDHVTTAAESYAYLMLDEAKAAKMDASTDVEVRSRGRKLELLLNSGNIYFGVSVPLEEDENLNIRTSSIAMGIRGTAGWVEAIEEGHSKVYILEGTVTGTVTDPVSGQSKSTTLHGGECADFYTYDASVPGDKVAIVRGQFTRGDIGGYVLKEVAGKDELIQKIYDDSGIDLRDLTAEEASAALAADEAAAAQEGEEPEEDEEEEEEEAEKTPVWKTGGSDGGDGSGGGASAPAVIVVREPAEAAESYTLSGSGSDFTLAASTDSHVKANGDGTYSVESDPTNGTNVNLTLTPADGYMVAEKDDVTVYSGTTALPDFTVTEGEPGRITGTANIAKDTAITVDGLYYKVTDASGIASALASNDRVAVAGDLAMDSDLTIPSGKTLLVFTGKTVRVDAGTALTIQGTLVNKGTIENYGTIANKSNHTLLNEGTIKNFGDIENGDEDEEGRIINEGVIRNDETSGASITNAAGSEIANGGSITNGGSGTIDNAGRLENTSSGTIDNTGAITNTGDIVNDGAIKGKEGTIDSTDGNLITTTDAVNENMVEGEVEIKAGIISTAVIGRGTLTADKKTAGAGETVSLTVAPGSGYELASLLALSAADGTKLDIEDGAFTMVEGDVVAIAVFTEVNMTAATYHLTIAETENGTVTADRTDAEADTTVVLTVTPADGYELGSLTVTGAKGTVTMTSASTFTMPSSDVTVTPVFEKIGVTPTYSVTVEAADHGTVAADMAEAKAGLTVVLTVEPDEGFELDSLTVTDEDGNPVAMTSASTFTMPASDVTVTATLTARPVTPTYAVTVEDSENGTVASDLTTAAEGQTVVLTVTPDKDFELDSLKINGATLTLTGGNTVYTFPMPPEDAAVTATFRRAAHRVILAPASHGSVTANAADAVKDDAVTLTVTPNEGYQLQSLLAVTAAGETVTVSGGSFTMPEEDVVVVGTFVPLSGTSVYPIQIKTNGYGTVGTDKSFATEGETVTLTVTPEEGFSIHNLVITDESGTEISLDGYAFTMPTSAVTVTADFRAGLYIIAVSYTEGGSVTALGSAVNSAADSNLVTAAAGTTVILDVHPVEGNELQSLIVVRTDNNTELEIINNTFLMPTSDVKVTAAFVPTDRDLDLGLQFSYSDGMEAAEIEDDHWADYLDEMYLQVNSNEYTVFNHDGLNDYQGLAEYRAPRSGDLVSIEIYLTLGYDLSAVSFTRQDGTDLTDVVERSLHFDYEEAMGWGPACYLSFIMPEEDVYLSFELYDGSRGFPVIVIPSTGGTVKRAAPENPVPGVYYWEVVPETGYDLQSIQAWDIEGNERTLTRDDDNASLFSFKPYSAVVLTPKFTSDTADPHSISIQTRGNGDLTAEVNGNPVVGPNVYANAGDEVVLVPVSGGSQIELRSCTYAYGTETYDLRDELRFIMPNSDVEIKAVFALEGSVIYGDLLAVKDLSDSAASYEYDEDAQELTITSASAIIESLSLNNAGDYNPESGNLVLVNSNLMFDNAYFTSITVDGDSSIYMEEKTQNTAGDVYLEGDSSLTLEGPGCFKINSVQYNSENTPIIELTSGALYVSQFIDLLDDAVVAGQIPNVGSNSSRRPLISVASQDISQNDSYIHFYKALLLLRISDQYTPVVPSSSWGSYAELNNDIDFVGEAALYYGATLAGKLSVTTCDAYTGSLYVPFDAAINVWKNHGGEFRFTGAYMNNGGITYTYLWVEPTD